MAKHVIILGAGASHTSGYPVGKELRIILSSREELTKWINNRLRDSKTTISRGKGHTSRLMREFYQHAKSVRLFREGAFETIDEFCYSARDADHPLHNEIQLLKWWVTICFAMHNPDLPYTRPGSQQDEMTTGFDHSDYFPFVNKLFNEHSCELREDVAVFTYNYDSSLDFVLWKAFKARKEVTTGKNVEWEQIPTALLSGLHNGDADDLLKTKGFCFLKLHGTSVLPRFPNEELKPGEPHALTFNEAFVGNDYMKGILNMLGSLSRQGQSKGKIRIPPIFFPWEILDGGKFVKEKDFQRVEGETGALAFMRGANKQTSNYRLFKAIWQRAQREITEAEQVSFVGFSANHFFKQGLQFLFKQRIKKLNSGHRLPLKVVTANPDSDPASFGERSPHRNTHVYQLQKLLVEACCGTSDFGEIIPYRDFETFIQEEL